MLFGGFCIIVFMHGNTKGLKEMLIGIVHGFYFGCPVENAGEDMQAYGLIVELVCQPLSTAKEIQGSICPVIAGANLCPWITLAFIGSSRGQQMPDCDLVDGLFPCVT